MRRKWFSIRRPAGNIDDSPEPSPPSPNHPISTPGSKLLAVEHRKRLVVLIKRSFSVTPEVWDTHYLYALERFAELVQEHPASRLHHHSQPGGLLDHTLDVTLRALRLSAGVILPPGVEPEELLHNAERWRFGVFICALLHDIGKVIGDQETVYKDATGRYLHWQPWHGPMPVGVPYVHRYRQTRGDHIHGLHEKLGITLLPFLLTPSASRWLIQDRTLLGQMMDTLAASATGAGIIGELIRTSDRASTAENLSPTTGIQESAESPLHVKILEALQTLANEGKLKRNMPGAGLWVGEELTYIVAKSTMEKVRDHLLTAGHKSIPQSPLRLMQILNEHGVTVPPVDNGDSQQAIVKDEQRSWEQKLSFVVIPNATLWVSGIPNVFKGTITPVDSNGLEVNHPIPPDTQGAETRFEKGSNRPLHGLEPGQAALQGVQLDPHTSGPEHVSPQGVRLDPQAAGPEHASPQGGRLAPLASGLGRASPQGVRLDPHALGPEHASPQRVQLDPHAAGPEHASSQAVQLAPHASGPERASPQGGRLDPHALGPEHESPQGVQLDPHASGPEHASPQGVQLDPQASGSETMTAKDEPATPRSQPKHGPVKVVSRNLSTKPAFQSKPGMKHSPLRSSSEFFAWMLNGIKYRRIRVNESGAPVHIVEHYVALITPKIFDLYLDDNKAIATVFGTTRDRQLIQLQREVKATKAHLVTAGEDFHKLMVRGPRRESAISALLIERDQFPELDKMSANPILQRCDT